MYLLVSPSVTFQSASLYNEPFSSYTLNVYNNTHKPPPSRYIAIRNNKHQVKII